MDTSALPVRPSEEAAVSGVCTLSGTSRAARRDGVRPCLAPGNTPPWWGQRSCLSQFSSDPPILSTRETRFRASVSLPALADPLISEQAWGSEFQLELTSDSSAFHSFALLFYLSSLLTSTYSTFNAFTVM